MDFPHTAGRKPPEQTVSAYQPLFGGPQGRRLTNQHRPRNSGPALGLPPAGEETNGKTVEVLRTLQQRQIVTNRHRNFLKGTNFTGRGVSRNNSQRTETGFQGRLRHQERSVSTAAGEQDHQRPPSEVLTTFRGATSTSTSKTAPILLHQVLKCLRSPT